MSTNLTGKEIRFDGRVAIVTGAGNGLGRSHALGLAKRGAKVVVNDLGVDAKGLGASGESARAVVDEIRAQGGEAIAHAANVAEPAEVQHMVDGALRRWGRVDVLVNNAGILRDKTFLKMSLDEFRLVVDVHLHGTAICTKAVWGTMREQNYGRVVMTTSSSGLYGNFGQANYAAAKMGVVGLMNTLHLEGIKHGIRINCLAPTAATRMTANLGISESALEALTTESVTPALLFLASERAPFRAIVCAGGGGFARTLIYETDGIWLDEASRSPETLAERFGDVSDPATQRIFEQGADQATKFIEKAVAARGPR